MYKTCKNKHSGCSMYDDFCYICGNPLIEIKEQVCRCHYILHNLDRFCPKCGEPRKEVDV